MKRKPRQLSLPGCTAPEEHTLSAKRDLSYLAFCRALRRIGIVPIGGGAVFVDEDGGRYTAIHRHNPLRVDLRATLAHIRRQRASVTRDMPKTVAACEAYPW